MDLSSAGPIFSGVVGGLIAILLCHALARWIPDVCDGKSVEVIVLENRVAIWCANAFFYSGWGASVAIVWLGFLPNDDWRALGLGVGGGSLAALISLPVVGVISGNSPKETFIAYAVSNQSPVLLVYGILLLCVISLMVALVSLLG